MTRSQTANMAIPPECDDKLRLFIQSCAELDLLARPEGLENEDLQDGLLDPSTLLRFLTARQYDTAAALKQFQEASQFRREKHIVRLHDMVEVTDFEQARQFVGFHFLFPDQSIILT
ncbi:hypothetical protein N7510_000662 [Penicillium lagena]|uniref:uncharacterized protein n=1 Tax=Penicillium lagena TaxID=94218 RepID=UPI0025424A66|nr:uncharacterized protein N7510_000662 [Penicillium lagena]KAJ5624353.1 hypothetical protein N7510_000662 [Penicillium lagena]